MQPRFSPDGKRIAFTSDRGGGDNIWVMNLDGSDKRQVTKEDFRLLNQPTLEPRTAGSSPPRSTSPPRARWGPARSGSTTWAAATACVLVKRASEKLQKELGEPTFAPDGKRIFYTRNVTPGPIFEYAQDSNTDLFDIERYDLDDGEVTTVVSGAGGSVRPTPSPDGKKLAFVRREREQVEALCEGPGLGREHQGLRRARPGRAGDLGGQRPLSEHGLDAGFEEPRLLGGRQDPARGLAGANVPSSRSG